MEIISDICQKIKKKKRKLTPGSPEVNPCLKVHVVMVGKKKEKLLLSTPTQMQVLYYSPLFFLMRWRGV